MKEFPVEVTAYRPVKKSFTFDHLFCAYCGKELTKLSLKTGKLTQSRHYIADTTIGVKLRYCWKREACEERKKLKGE